MERAEKWVAGVSAACAVHCLVVPLAVAVAPWLAVSEALEPVVLLGAAPVALLRVWRDVRRHGRAGPCALVLAGLLAWMTAALTALEAPVHAAVVGTGGLVVFAGLRWSGRLAAVCEVHGS